MDDKSETNKSETSKSETSKSETNKSLKRRNLNYNRNIPEESNFSFSSEKNQQQNASINVLWKNIKDRDALNLNELLTLNKQKLDILKDVVDDDSSSSNQHLNLLKSDMESIQKRLTLFNNSCDNFFKSNAGASDQMGIEKNLKRRKILMENDQCQQKNIKSVEKTSVEKSSIEEATVKGPSFEEPSLQNSSAGNPSVGKPSNEKLAKMPFSKSKNLEEIFSVETDEDNSQDYNDKHEEQIGESLYYYELDI